MQAMIEPIVEAIYLVFVILIGIIMLRGAKTKNQSIFGFMTLLLGLGDAFHLIPRVVAIWGKGFNHYVLPLGIGKFVTSITMTLFYLFLYHIWKNRYHKENKDLDLWVNICVAIRIIICFFPQNAWFQPNTNLFWAILRNIPFVLLGLTLIILFHKEAKQDKYFKYMWIAILFSFIFYLPVIIWADTIPYMELLMIPKTCIYIWIVWMGFKEFKEFK